VTTWQPFSTAGLAAFLSDEADLLAIGILAICFLLVWLGTKHDDKDLP
jgi:hypothetical protein